MTYNDIFHGPTLMRKQQGQGIIPGPTADHKLVWIAVPSAIVERPGLVVSFV